LALGAAALLIASFAIGVMLSRRSTEPAQWRIDDTFEVEPSSTEIPILITEADCASGQLATDRIHVDIDYSESAVTIGIEVKPLGGSQSCQAVGTLFVVRLREPLGERVLVDANAPNT
jgi:hypothetical protein